MEEEEGRGGAESEEVGEIPRLERWMMAWGCGMESSFLLRAVWMDIRRCGAGCLQITPLSLPPLHCLIHSLAHTPRAPHKETCQVVWKHFVITPLPRPTHRPLSFLPVTNLSQWPYHVNKEMTDLSSSSLLCHTPIFRSIPSIPSIG